MSWENIPASLTCGRTKMPPLLLALAAGAKRKSSVHLLRVIFIETFKWKSPTKLMKIRLANLNYGCPLMSQLQIKKRRNK